MTTTYFGPSVSSLGVGSGLDATGIISSLMAVEYRPYNLMTTRISSYQTELSSLGQIQSLTATMRDKAGALAGVTLWGQKTATSADPATVTASVTSSAAAGRYSVAVQQLAASQSVHSGTYADSAATVGSGSLTIELGAWAGSSFTAQKPPASTTINIDPTSDTSLAGMRDQINAANAGVTASIVNDASGARLVLTSTSTGETNGFRISATETVDDGVATTGLSALAFDPGSGATQMTQTMAAANAQATINGLAVASASNTFANVSDGLSITVAKVNPAAVDVTVGDDTASVRTAINDFVSAFNSLVTAIHTQTKYDEATKTAAPLQGDATVNSLYNQLRGVINEPSTASGMWSTLSDIGLAMGPDGTLKTDTAKLEEALKNPTELRKLLATAGADTASSGFMVRFRNLGDAVLSVDGSLPSHQRGIQTLIDTTTDRQEQMKVRLDRTEERLRKQYEALDASMASLNALSAFVSQQLAMLYTSK